MKYVKGLLINLQFFTTIPIPITLPMDKAHLQRSVQTFPILGLIQGMLYVVVLYSLMQWTPLSPLAIAFIFTVCTIVFTGGLHLDGWVDTCDALFSYREKEQRLEIMSDPRVGAFGVISVIILLSSRLLFFYEMILNIQPFSYVLFAIVPMFSKTAMGYLLIMIPAAKNTGLAYLFQQAVKKNNLFIYVIYWLIVFLGLAFIHFSFVKYSLILLLAASLFVVYFSRKTKQSFGGITGDLLGAAVEGVEAILWMIVWLLHYYVMV